MPDKYLGTSIADRRRTQRRQLQRPTAIRIRTADEGDGTQFEARMLNLSEHGLACRMNTSHASRLTLGQTVSIAFHLPSTRTNVACEARIANLTPGGSPARCVVGMEFVHPPDDDSTRRRLRAELERMTEWVEGSPLR